VNRNLAETVALKRRLGRWWKRGLLALLALVIVFAIVRAWMPKPVSVETVAAERGSLTVTVDEDGQARVEDRYVVSAPLAGRLARIELEPGDEIARGQTLARIVPVLPPLLDVRTRDSAKAQLAAALAAERQASAQIERARASMQFAKVEADRDRQLFARNVIGRGELDQTLLRERTSRAELESSQFGARVADHEVAMARAALKRLSAVQKDAAEQLDVPSPIKGRVLKVLQESEGVVQPGAPLVEVGDPAALEIVVDVLTSDAVRMRAGAKVSIERWGGAPLEGRVRRIEPSAFTRLSALGVEEQRVNVQIGLADPRAKWQALGDGYRVEVRIVVWENEDVLKVPTSAVFRHAGGWAAFVVVDDIARLRQIEIGERTARELQVVRGIEPGERVVIHPSDRVADGVEVEAR
jgi:HlyD family secretion protein